jgi:hypothetical protein
MEEKSMNLIKKMFAKNLIVVRDEQGELVGFAANDDEVKDLIIDYFYENCEEHFIMWKDLHCAEMSSDDAFIKYYSEVLKPLFSIKHYGVAK